MMMDVAKPEDDRTSFEVAQSTVGSMDSLGGEGTKGGTSNGSLAAADVDIKEPPPMPLPNESPLALFFCMTPLVIPSMPPFPSCAATEVAEAECIVLS
eukprot:CAMPEP_0181137590 /NCGR_PEP_ID=MMETSP1071-20121207/33784_1 /TAXON_ID=35127 /ORGANISM="Thalassiosira sp., Strain NH16" /LENGTH=97 /DNA_ID=CAMNT_0023224349 /DNA_START=320 /DNA_END=614 /DNA_ORIENTATION=+